MKETIYWLDTCNFETKNCKYTEQIISKEWLKIAPRKLTIEDEIKYCDPVLLQTVLNAKVLYIFTYFLFT